MWLLRVELEADEAAFPALERFYGDELGLRGAASASTLTFPVGSTALEFRPVRGRRPFYHFALRVPRNRFEAARAWLAARTELLAEPESAETTFEFSSWNAVACYAHDPVGNIVELIAHNDLPDESDRRDAFTAAELLGVCELGFVGRDKRGIARALEPLGIHLWDGTLDAAGLAFLGERDGTLILAPVGRGWMPTGRPAEIHAAAVVARGSLDAEVAVPGTPYRVRTASSSTR